MADVTLTIPNEHVDRVREAFANLENVDLADYGVAEFKASLIFYVKDVVRRYETKQARDQIVIVPPDVT